MADRRLMVARKSQLPDLTRRGFLVSMCAAGAVFGFPKGGLQAAMDPAVQSGMPIEPAGADTSRRSGTGSTRRAR